MAKPNPIFVAEIKQGCLSWHQPEAIDRYIRSMEGERVKVIIKPFKAGDRIRSLDANAYYWGVVIEIARDYFGYEKEELHDALGLLFRVDRSKAIPTVIKTSTMSSREFWEYIERVRRWAAVEYNITIPDPNKVEGAK